MQVLWLHGYAEPMVHTYRLSHTNRSLLYTLRLLVRPQYSTCIKRA